MARITVEDCLQKVNNRFTLIHMAAKRVRQLRKGAEPTIHSKNKDIVVSLREIAAGNLAITDAQKETPLLENEQEMITTLPEPKIPETPPEDNEEEEKTAEGR